MKQRAGISPILLEMIFVLLFFSLSAAVIVQLLGAAAVATRESREKSAALEALAVAMETALADPAALAAKGTQSVAVGDFTVETTVAPAQSGNGVYYSVDSKATKDGETLLSLQGGRFVAAEAQP